VVLDLRAGVNPGVIMAVAAYKQDALNRRTVPPPDGEDVTARAT
jgi:hypothetical protein